MPSAFTEYGEAMLSSVLRRAKGLIILSTKEDSSPFLTLILFTTPFLQIQMAFCRVNTLTGILQLNTWYI